MHWIVVIQLPISREIRILELRSRHHEAILDAQELGDNLVGHPLWVWREASDHGEPIEVSLFKPAFAPQMQSQQSIETSAIPCSKYCEAIGRKEYFRALANLGAIRPRDLGLAS